MRRARIRVLLNVLAEDEERGPQPFPREDIEKLRCHRLRAVIERQCHHAAGARVGRFDCTSLHDNA